MKKNSVFAVLAIVFFILGTTVQVYALPFKGNKIAMSAANKYAVDAGTHIAEKGGNAVDVAITMALTMSVTNPYFASVGGGGFAMVKMGPKVEVLDFRERAPSAANEDYYKSKKKDASMTGGTAVAIPGMPAGYYELHKKYGKVHWSLLFDEAIRLASKGFYMSGELAANIIEEKSRFNSTARAVFVKPNGANYKPGEKIVQTGYANMLKLMRNRNVTPFYSGDVAVDIINSANKAGGELTLKDMKEYKPVWREPMKTKYAGHTIYLMPPPSSGGVVLQTALALTEQLDVEDTEIYSIDEYHLLGEILSRAFRGRSLIGDPDYFQVPLDKLLSQDMLTELKKSISTKEATTITALSEVSAEKAETTHLSVLDSYGNAVAMTITLNGNFGSGVVTDKYGITLNNEMDDFTTKPGEPNMFGLVQGSGNNVKGGKRPLSSMSPTLVDRNGQIVMALGAPGGPRIISSVYQTLYRTLGRKQSLERAIEAPRLHHQLLPNKLFVDKGRFAPETLIGLKDKKHVVEESWLGRVYAVQNKDGILEAVADSRGEGAVGGF